MPSSKAYRDDVRWVYEQLSLIRVKNLDGSCSIDPSKATVPPPAESALGVAQWAVDYQPAFYQTAAKVLVEEENEDGPDAKPVLRRKLDVQKIDEILATVTELHGIDAVVNAQVAERVRTLLRQVRLRLSHEFELQKKEQQRKMAKWKADGNQRAFEVAELTLGLIEELASKVDASLEYACGTAERSSAETVADGESAVPASAQ